MALDIQCISLDISKQPTPQQVRLGQGDANATTLIVKVYDTGDEYDLDGYGVRLATRLPNSDNYYGVNGTAQGNVATFEIDETYAAATHGFDGYGYVEVLDGDTVICSTSRFQLVVLRSAEDGADPSTAYSNGIIEATERAIAAAEAAEGVILQDVPMMSATILGGAKVGSGLSIDENGVLSAAAFAGILPIANGGTGADNASGARTSLGITPANIGAAPSTHQHSASDITSGELPITHGGTGATSASAARTNLGITPANIGAAAYSNGAINIGGTSAYLLFTTSAIASFSPPTGVSACMVLDTSDDGLYWYTS